MVAYLIPELTVKNYMKFIRSFLSSKEGKVYLCKSKLSEQFAVCVGESKSACNSKDFEPLSFREIVWVAMRYNSALKESFEHAKSVANALEKMKEHKEANVGRENRLIAMVRAICDYVVNLFHGYGFFRSEVLAKQLYFDLRAVKDAAASTFSPSYVVLGTPSKGSGVRVGNQIDALNRKVLQSRKEVVGSSEAKPLTGGPQNNENLRKRALEKYRKGAFLNVQEQTVLFGDIKAIEKHLAKPSLTVEGLMLDVSGLREVDLMDAGCKCVITDVLRICTKETAECLVNWLKGKKMSEALMLDCMNALLDRKQKGQPVSVYTLQSLLERYNSSREASYSDRVAKAAMKLLLEQAPNDSITIRIFDSICSRELYTQEALQDWEQVFTNRSTIHDASPNLHYPISERLKNLLSR